MKGVKDMLQFQATPRQWATLEGLAYWISDNAYCIESMPREEYQREEYQRHDQSIRSIFDALDRLGVPYWVQNAVIMWASDWRREATEYMDNAMQRRNITRATV